METKLKIGKYEFNSRLIVGTGKYVSFDVMKAAHEASGADLVTVAISRVNLKNPDENILNFIDTKRFTLLPNTAGAYTAEDAIRITHLAEAACNTRLIKLEVIGDKKTLMPDTEALLQATRELVREGFIVMPYTNDDPVMARKLEDAGAACVMPLAAPIGSGLGVQNPLNIKFIRETVRCPVIVDAGVGTASDACACMELGVDGVLMNTAIACADNPVWMAEAMRDAVIAGRKAFFAGRMPKKEYASASSPQDGLQTVKLQST